MRELKNNKYKKEEYRQALIHIAKQLSYTYNEEGCVYYDEVERGEPNYFLEKDCDGWENLFYGYLEIARKKGGKNVKGN